MKNYEVKNIAILIHGVNTRKNKGWLAKFKKYFDGDPSFDSHWIAINIYYGYIHFLLSVIPFVRHSKIREVQQRLRDIQEKYPNATIHVLAHSYGTMLTYQAVKRSDLDTSDTPLKLGKLITIGGIIDETEKFKDTLQEGQIQSVHNFCSYEDLVIKFQPIFGKSGYTGFLKNKSDKKHYYKPHTNINIKNYRFNLKHSEYFSDDPPNFYVLWSQILRRK